MKKRLVGLSFTIVMAIIAFVSGITMSLAPIAKADVVTVAVVTNEVDEKTMQSKLVKGLYFAGEILDVDGDCGGFNLQWAFSSAMAVAKAIK